MSTELKSHAQDVSLTRFFGGKDRGSCVQVTTPRANRLGHLGPADNLLKSMQLTRAQEAA